MGNTLFRLFELRNTSGVRQSIPDRALTVKNNTNALKTRKINVTIKLANVSVPVCTRWPRLIKKKIIHATRKKRYANKNGYNGKLNIGENSIPYMEMVY